ncbi:MAG: hypothetical protein MUC64_11915, partial [Rubritepida sp.]|nr:hypothetical protein [Rubritepida sp.]
MPEQLRTISPWAPVAVAASVSAVPAAVLALLAAVDVLKPWPAAVTALAVCVCAIVFGLLWHRDLLRLAASLEA